MKIATVQATREGIIRVNYYDSKKEAIEKGIALKNAKFEESPECFNYISIFNWRGEREDQVELDRDDIKIAYFFYNENGFTLETE